MGGKEGDYRGGGAREGWNIQGGGRGRGGGARAVGGAEEAAVGGAAEEVGRWAGTWGRGQGGGRGSLAGPQLIGVLRSLGGRDSEPSVGEEQQRGLRGRGVDAIAAERLPRSPDAIRRALGG